MKIANIEYLQLGFNLKYIRYVLTHSNFSDAQRSDYNFFPFINFTVLLKLDR